MKNAIIGAETTIQVTKAITGAASIAVLSLIV